MSNIVVYNGQDIMAEYDTYYAEGYRAVGQLYPVMAEDLRMYLGEQWSAKERESLNEEGRQTFTINKSKAKIDWINGYQIQNRLSSVAVPLLDSSQKTADQLTKLLLYVLQSQDGYRFISETFSSGNKTGWSLLNLYQSYIDDPVNGDICFGRSPYSAIIMDPYFTRLDLDFDCNWLTQRKYISPTQAAALLPDQEDEVMSLARDGWERDNKFTWMVFQRVPTGQRMMAYNEFWRKKYKDQKVIVNRMTKQFVDWNGSPDDYQEMQQKADQMGHELYMVNRKKRYVEKHIIVNNNYMRTEVNPYDLDEYPFALYCPIFESESEDFTCKFQSLQRQLNDPQRELNRRRSQIIDVVESQLNSGWIEEDGAVKNPKMLYFSGQGRRIVLNRGFKRDAVDRIQPAVVPASFFQETDQAERDLMEILGLNPTNMGDPGVKQVSALVEMQRQAQGLIGQQEIFDKLREFQKIVSRKIMRMVQHWSPAKVQRIIGEQPTPEFYDKNFTKYDIAVQEGILTDTQRYMQFRQVLELKELGEPIPPGSLMEIAPIQGKSEFNEKVKAYSEQQNKMQAQLQQQQLQESQALTQGVQSKAVADLARAERDKGQAASFYGLEASREADVIHKEAQSILDRVKAAKELQSMDDEKMHKYVQIIKDMEEIENRKVEMKQASNEAKSDTIV